MWFVFQNITYDAEERCLTGNCLTGPYLGEMEAYVPDDVVLPPLCEGDTVRILGGPGMTMSIPPQLMGVCKVERVDEAETAERDA